MSQTCFVLSGSMKLYDGTDSADGGGSRAAAVLELLKTVVFSWLIGNGDLHGKNMSSYGPKGFWQPSPAYDLLTTQPYSEWRDPMALTLYGRANRLDRAHFLDAATRLGLRDRAAARMIDDVTEAARGWTDHRTVGRNAGPASQVCNARHCDPDLIRRTWAAWHTSPDDESSHVSSGLDLSKRIAEDVDGIYAVASDGITPSRVPMHRPAPPPPTNKSQTKHDCR
jgi:hypothetical protein